MNEAIGEFEQHRLNLLLSLLTKRQRAVMELVIQGYDYYEIADKLRKSYNAVKLSVVAARKRLKGPH
ncbi:MAG: sigma factor-like helix-turn-helix DNA-binding protein [Sphingobacterium sp.]